MSNYHEIILAGDIMFENKVAFFETISCNLKFGTTEMLPNQKSKAILGNSNRWKQYIITTALPSLQ